MANRYFCSNGERVTDATIKARLSKAYRAKYEGEPHPSCEGCGARSQGTSHILSQKDCKSLHRSELIWNPINWFPACHKCNSKWESNNSTLLNYKKCMDVLKTLDETEWQLRTNFKK